MIPSRVGGFIGCGYRTIMHWNPRLALLAVLLLGFLLRIEAFQWNWFMHGDVMGDAIVAAELRRDGRLIVFQSPKSADPSLYTLPPLEEGEPLMQHGPLWPILGATLTLLRDGASTVADGFLSLRTLSLFAGTLVIVFVFLIGSRLLEPIAGLSAAAFAAISYVLIDFSGNGAFYSFQAVLYLLWVLVALKSPSLRRTLLMGFLAGITYLVNFQAIIMIPAGLVVLLFQERSWKRLMFHAILLIGVAILVTSPWLVRNAILFGDPLYSHAVNMQYVYGKSGFHVPTGFNLGLLDNLSILAGVFHTWLPYNLYYAARKLFVIAPVTFFLFSFGLIDLVFSYPRLRKSFPLLAILTFHILLSASWPIWKFRFFVPLLPLVFLLAVEQLWSLPLTKVWKHFCIGTTLIAMIVVGILTYRATPLHTTYYDGALTQDAFHGSEERTYLEEYGIFPKKNVP